MTLPIEVLFFPLALLAYLPCLRGPLIFDAIESVKEVKAWQWSRAWYRKRYGKAMPYRVLSVLSWAADLWRARVTGADMDRCRTCEGQATWALHTTNVAIHAVNAMVVGFIGESVGLPRLLTGAVFLLHPFAANSVANIPARASLLSATFGFLAVLAALSAHPLYIVPALGLAVLTKEDGAGFVFPVLAVLLWHGDNGLALGLWAIGMVAFLKYLPMLKDFIHRNGDKEMAPSGLPVSLPFRDHGYTVAVETLIRLPKWAVGFGMSPYHGSGMPVPGFWKLLGSVTVVAAVMQCPPVVAILILAGPWLIYLVCPVPDQLMEYRNYSIVAGFALLIAAVPSVYVVLPFFLALTAIRSFPWSSRVEMWKEAARCASGDPSRALQEIGAWLKLDGKRWEAEPYLKDAVKANPRLAPAWDNLAWVQLETGRTEKGIATLEHCTRVCPDYPIAFEELGAIYQQQGRLEEAEMAFQRANALERAPHRENRIGLMRFYQRQYDVAFHWFKKALDATGDYQYLWNCGMSLKFAGDIEGARDCETRLKAQLKGGDILGTHEMVRYDYREPTA